jgi:hypothetical protein
VSPNRRERGVNSKKKKFNHGETEGTEKRFNHGDAETQRRGSPLWLLGGPRSR